MRELSFKLGSVNIITGRSLTGKSAIVDIIDYCMGRSTFNILKESFGTGGRYAVIFKIGDNTHVLVAKPAPTANAASQSTVYYEVGSLLAVPPFSKLVPIRTIKRSSRIFPAVSGSFQICIRRSQVNRAMNWKPRFATRSTISFRHQGLIANKDLLFHRQQEQLMPQTIEDTLPIFRGD